MSKLTISESERDQIQARIQASKFRGAIEASINSFLFSDVYAYIDKQLISISHKNFSKVSGVSPVNLDESIIPFRYKYREYGHSRRYHHSNLDKEFHAEMDGVLNIIKLVEKDEDLIGSYIKTVTSLCHNMKSMLELFPSCLHAAIKGTTMVNPDFCSEPKYDLPPDQVIKLKEKYKEGEQAVHQFLTVTLLLIN